MEAQGVGSDLLWTVVVVALGLVFGGGLAFWLRRSEAQRRDALMAMGGRRSWSVALRQASGGKPRSILVTPQDGAGWQCEVTSRRGTTTSADGSGTTIRVTEFTDPACPAPAGQAIALGPGLPPEAAALAGSLLGSLQGPMGQTLLGKLFGDVGAAAAGLRPAEALSGAGNRFTGFATGAVPSGLDLPRIEAAVAAWQARHAQEEAFPILLWHPGGLTIRMRTDAMEAGMLEGFIDTALAMRAALPGRAG